MEFPLRIFMAGWWWDNYKSRQRRHSSSTQRNLGDKNGKNMSHCVENERDGKRERFLNKLWILKSDVVWFNQKFKSEKGNFYLWQICNALNKIFIVVISLSHTFFYDNSKKSKTSYLHCCFSVYIARFVYQIHDLNNKTSVNMERRLLKLECDNPN